MRLAAIRLAAQRIFRAIPVTPRCLAAVGLICYLLLGPPSNAHDIVSAYVGYGLLLTVTYVLVGGLVSKGLLTKSLTVELLPGPIPAGQYLSGKPIPLFIRLIVNHVLPLFRLQCYPNWPVPYITHKRPEVSGLVRNSAVAEFPVTFPHRGDWAVRTTTMTYRDVLGLVSFSWEAPLEHPLQLLVAPEVPDLSAPEIASSHRTSGDNEAHIVNADGDMFDLRRYDPSDGIRRIVWNIFARTGQLVSRFPEPSIRPEGKTTLFALAGKWDDEVAAEAIVYVRTALEQQVEIRFGCLGMKESHPARTYADTVALLIESVWDAHTASLFSDLEHFISALEEGHDEEQSTTIALLVGERLVIHPGFEEQLRKMLSLLGSKNITPLWYISCSESRSATQKSYSNRLYKSLAWWFFPRQKHNRREPVDPALLQASVQHIPGRKIFRRQISFDA